MGSTHHMPFGIEFVTEQLGIFPAAGAGDRVSWYTQCPFCGKKRKLNINVDKDTWHCPACGEGGGMVSLYAKCREIDNREAAKELYRLYGGTDCSVREEIQKRKDKISSMPHSASADLFTRDAVNRSLIRHLTLDGRHREDLLKRGLTDEVIDKLGYRSTPQQGLRDIAAAMQSEGMCLEHIPGFHGIRSKSVIWRKPGILIPVRTLNGHISGFQIRYDSLPDDASDEEREKYRKYTWFQSSEKKGGTAMSGNENIHHAGFFRGAGISRICLTEGCLKADIASFLSGMPFVGLTGVSNTGRLETDLLELREAGAKEVFVCMDMDYLTNRNVKKALDRILCICDRTMKTTYVTWPEEYKGIDDFLWYKRQRGLI